MDACPVSVLEVFLLFEAAAELLHSISIFNVILVQTEKCIFKKYNPILEFQPFFY